MSEKTAATDAAAVSFDDLEPVSPREDGDTVRLDPGESIVATVRHVQSNASKHGNDLLHLTTQEGEHVQMWSNATISRELEAADVGPGDVVGIRKEKEPYTYTVEGDDGEEEEREAYGFEVRA
jgi:hypothetical protein